MQRTQCCERRKLVSGRSPSSWRDEERITKMQTLVDRLQGGYRTKSIMNDLKRNGVSNEFSEASRRTIEEMGNIELHQLGETVRTNLVFSSLILCTSSNKEHMESSMDLRSGSTIIGKPKMPQRQPSRRDGTMIRHIEKLNRNVDGLSSTASSSTSSKQSKSCTRRLGTKEIATRTSTY